MHVYYSKETHHMISHEQFGKMKSTAILINTARGAVVDPAALHWALTGGVIAAAALDVTEPEPIPSDSPLLGLNNIIITPHIASASKETRERMAHIAVENLLAGIKGQPLPHCVNPDVYSKRGG
jgi:glyoxylate reductase